MIEKFKNYNVLEIPKIPNKQFLVRVCNDLNDDKHFSYLKKEYTEYNYCDYSDFVVVYEMSKYLKMLEFTSEDVWADLGANIGSFGVLIHDKVKKIYGVEPSPTNCEVIKAQIEFNKLDNYSLIEAALVSSDEQKTIDLFINSISMGFNTIRKSRSTIGIIQVPTLSFSKLLEEHPDINKVKMDIEGAEYEIIINYNNWSNIKELFVEFHGGILKDKNTEQPMYNMVINHLKKHFEIVKAPLRTWNGLALIRCKN